MNMVDYLIILLATISVLGMVLYISREIYIPKKILKKTEETLRSYLDNEDITYSLTKVDTQNADFSLALNQSELLIKVIKGSPRKHIVITNKTTWIETENTGALNIKKKLSDVVPFVTNDGNRVKKIAIIYPDARKILKYINENEVVFVTEDTDVYGVKVVRFNALESFIKSLLTK